MSMKTKNSEVKINMYGQDEQDLKPRTTKDTKSTNLERDAGKQDKK